jgi:hypothetical protein
MTDQQFIAWLHSSDAFPVTLVEVSVDVGGTVVTRYLSSSPYVTGPAETPPNRAYQAIIDGGMPITEQVSLEGDAGLVFGDIELANHDGSLDAWAFDVWRNQPIKQWIGDARWPLSDFLLVFSGIVDDIDGTKDVSKLNIKIRDKMQRLNTAITDAKLGGTGSNADAIIPLVFGEGSNVVPLLIDSNTLTYQVHDGRVDSIEDVRDLGVPVLWTPDAANGKFTLQSGAKPAAITVSVKGDAPGGVYSNRIAPLVQRIVTGYGEAASRFGATSQLAPGSYDYTAADLVSFARASTATYIDASGIVQTAAINAPRIDYLSGAGQLLIEAVATNLLKNSEGLVSTYEANSGVSNGTTLPGFANAAQFGTNGTDRWAYHTFATNIGTQYTLSFFVQMDDGLAPVIGITNTTGDFGIVMVSTFGNFTPTVTKVGTALYRVSATYLAGASNQNYGVVKYSGMSARGFRVTGYQLEAGPVATSYIPTAASAVTRAADVAMQFDDIDSGNLAAFDVSHPQLAGLVVSDRTNVITACQQLAASVGAQVIMSATGLLRLIQIALPAPGPITNITVHNIRTDDGGQSTFRPVERLEVKGAVKVGYCKIPLVQPSLVTDIPTAHKDLYAKEWLTKTAKDDAVLARYKLDADPAQRETCLMIGADAQAEAQRELDLRKVPRTVYQFEGTPEMLMLKLGAAGRVTYPRYGLAAGADCVVVMLAKNWAQRRVTVGVMA